jgi:hypothetical protein
MSGNQGEEAGPLAATVARVVRVAFLVRPPRLEAALILLLTLSTLACLAPLLSPRLVVVPRSLSPRSALWLRVDLVLRPTGLCDWRSLDCFGGEDA